MVEMNKLYEVLVAAAQCQKTVSYREIAQVLRLDGGQPR